MFLKIDETKPITEILSRLGYHFIAGPKDTKFVVQNCKIVCFGDDDYILKWLCNGSVPEEWVRLPEIKRMHPTSDMSITEFIDRYYKPEFIADDHTRKQLIDIYNKHLLFYGAVRIEWYLSNTLNAEYLIDISE